MSTSLCVGVPWNGRGSLRPLLERCEQLTWVEQVLVSPTDESARSAAEGLSSAFPKLQVLASGDKGIYSAYNKLIGSARTTHICFHGADDLICPNDLGSALADAGEDDMLVFSLELRRADGERVAVIHHEETVPPRVALGRHTSPGTPEVVYPVAVLKAVGGADESFRIAGDADLYFRVRQRVRRLDHGATFAVMTDGGASTTARNALIVLNENRRIARAHRQRIPLHAQLTAAAALGVRYWLFRAIGEARSSWVIDALRGVAGRPRRYSVKVRSD